MASSDEKSEYSVVEFFEKRNGLKCVELVPSSWVEKDCDKFMCRYPHGSNKKKIDKWIENEVEPLKDWPLYPVQILATASKYFYFI